ncbi:LysR family transcriptional regulator [Paenibacillus radicis (ex Gao et al. 2016)]|uniref:HTH-type transcriptional regulator CzcR n=1 Tax=Paenibacillus radicis (ex Gao et al. 2016) TaxID=1737354 RepID=A0A917GPP8_9BACL|nr:LysR family transcriptional regulator [Paenibacillus radicis (ex Gao et al. 2016)]GGG52767.1 HTH-type transcriptional regulator CzcR [Paenibacillus radicis (ex Gao et al. 2016)]
MEINDLKIFKAVAEFGSVSQAALELSYVQSNVTARIKRLEKELQTELFYRHKRGMVLNAEGKRLLEYAEDILGKMEEIKRAFQGSDDPSGILNIGVVEPIFSLPGLLSEYLEKHPHVDLSLTVGVTARLLQDVTSMKLDGAFVTGPVKHPLIDCYEVFREELILVSKNENSTLDDIVKKPLLLFNKGCGYRERLESWLKGEGIIPKQIMQFGSFDTIIGSITAGICVTIVPKSSVRRLIDDGTISGYSIPKPYNEVTTIFICKKDSYLTPTLRSFIEKLQHI